MHHLPAAVVIPAVSHCCCLYGQKAVVHRDIKEFSIFVELHPGQCVTHCLAP